MQLHRVKKFVNLAAVAPEIAFLIVNLRVVIELNLPTDLHSLHWNSQTRWTFGMPTGALNVAMISVDVT